MNEKLLQYLWQFKLLAAQEIHTQNGDNVAVIDPGQLNTDAGPDFFNSKIKMNNTTWVGNIEIHLKSSNWFLHNHHTDKSYNNVILHVVLEDDKPTFNEAGRTVPTVVLTIPEHVKQNYQRLEDEKTWLKCSKSIHKIDRFFWIQLMESLAIERLEAKMELVQKLLKETNNDWEQTCYIMLAKSFGFNVNADPFVLLAKRIPHKLLLHYSNNLSLMEALLFGAAGFLDEMLNEDEYYQRLSVDFRHLQHKHNIQALQKHLWKFAKTRPSNFPSIRIAQFAKLYFQHNNIFAKILETKQLKALTQIFMVEASSYWDSHYRYNLASVNKKKQVGYTATLGIVINTIVPLLFTYGKIKDNNSFCEQALLFLEEIPAEKNAKTNDWEQFGINSVHAKDSQSLIHLRNNYCNLKKCLQCRIGLKTLTLKQA